MSSSLLDTPSPRPKMIFRFHVSWDSIGAFRGAYLTFPLLLMCFHCLGCFGVLISSLQGEFCVLGLLCHLLTFLLVSLAVFGPFQRSSHPCARSAHPRGSTAHPPTLCTESLCQQVSLAVLASLTSCMVFAVVFVPFRSLCTSVRVVDTSATFTKLSVSSLHQDSNR